MAVAELLGKFVFEVENEMPYDEFADWLAWMRLKRELQDKENKRQESRNKRRRS